MAGQHVSITGHSGQAMTMSSTTGDNMPRIQSEIAMSAMLLGLTAPKDQSFLSPGTLGDTNKIYTLRTAACKIGGASVLGNDCGDYWNSLIPVTHLRFLTCWRYKSYL